jgi:putative ABC transport system permease protein
VSLAWIVVLAARLVPGALGARHGGEMLDAARRLLARERGERGRAAELVLAARLAADFVRVAVLERNEARRAFSRRARDSNRKGRSPMSSGIALDLRDALRGLRRAPGHTAACLLTVALAVGATAAIFTVVWSVLLGGLPYAAPERLLTIWESNAERGWRQAPAAPANLFDWRDRAETLDDVAGFADYFKEEVITAPGEPTAIKTMNVAGDLFGVLGATPLLGRTPRDEETWAGGEPVVLLSYRFWQRRFAGDPTVVGRRVEIDREPVTVVGVMPESFTLWSDETDAWRPFGWTAEQKARVSFRRAHYVRAVARLAPGVSAAAAQAELASIATALEHEYPETNRGMGVGTAPLRDWLVGDLRRPLWLLFAAVVLVLLVGCANVAHLELARALARRRENAVRASLGASGWRLARRALIDSLLLSTLGGALGLVLARVALPSLVRLGGAELSRLGSVEVGPAALVFAAILAVVTALVAGAAPALEARATDPERTLRDGGRAGEGGRGSLRARRLLVAGEVALAVVLVAGALLLVRSLRALDGVRPGFDTAGLLTARLALPPLAYPDTADKSAFGARLLERVEALPGVKAAGLANRLPATEDSWSSDFSVEGRAEQKFGIEVIHREVSPGYFAALGVPLLAGRLLLPSDDPAAPLAVVVNEAFVRRHFPNESPLGLRICFDGDPAGCKYWYTIVGVVGDERQASLTRPARPEILASHAQDPNGAPFLVVRAEGDVMALVPALRAVLRELDPQLPLFEVRSMSEIVARSRTRERFVLTLFAAFSGLAFALAAIGVYGVAAHSAAGRRREIGVRMALGADARRVVRGFVASGAGTIGVGALLGVGGALVLGRAMASLLYETAPADPLSLGAAPVLLFLVANLASWLPARRAARVDPAEVLRAE